MELLNDWKRANVGPFLRKGRRKSGNFRPVSLTLISRKIMEQVLKESVVKHLGKNKVIRKSQHGFTKTKVIPVQPDLCGERLLG